MAKLKSKSSLRKKPSRRCSDRLRYNDLVNLRQWRESVFNATNAGRKRRLISDRREIEYISWNMGWTTYVNITLVGGYSISMSSHGYGGLKWNPGYEECVCMRLYYLLSRVYRDKENL